MRIQKGLPHFSKKEVWNLDSTLAPIIYTGLVQFKQSIRYGFSKKAITQYLIDIVGLTPKEVLLRLSKNPNDYNANLVGAYYETLLDKMIFAFNTKAHLDYSDIEESITISSLTNPEAFDEEIHSVDSKGNRYSRVMFKPKQGFTQEDVDAYNERSRLYNLNLENSIQEGLDLFSKYFYSLWS